MQLDIHGQPYSAPTPPPVPVVRTPVENPVWSGWDVLLIAVLIFAVVVLLQLGFAKAAQLLWYPRLSIPQAMQKVEQKPILVILGQFLFYVPVALIMIVSVEGKYRVPFLRTIGWRWPRSAWPFLLLGAGLFLVLAALGSILPMPKETPFQQLFDRPLDAYLLAFIAIILAPFIEELYFRGLLYPVLARRLGIGWGIFLSALPFAALHLPQYAWAWGIMLIILVVGIVCGIVRAKTKSVGASFLVHMGYNGIQMLLEFALTHGFRHMKAALFLH